MDSSLIGTCIYSSSLDSDIALESVLGAGSFSTVYLGVSEESCHNVYAVKAVSKANLNVRQLDLIRGESALMNRVHDHPHILTLFDTIETASHLFMVTEYCEMDFYEALVEHYPNGFADPNVIKQICQQLLDAVIYCHGKGVYHRDIKPENILVSRDYSIRLADFGLATSDEW